ncbi:hypothetical protein [Mycobacterium genavense]|uniref:hypothetical protein n=1 Tax=Mycobacterium genavense TaxID=36812 RepID=UPI000472202C|nr:hypothetical protein [Mycobacterium genavense]
MIRIIATSLLALGGLLTTAVGVANADEIQVDGVYSTLGACEADGSHVELAHDDQLWTHWDCRQHTDGLYYLYLTN